jgi:hypothetical protein
MVTRYSPRLIKLSLLSSLPAGLEEPELQETNIAIATIATAEHNPMIFFIVLI